MNRGLFLFVALLLLHGCSSTRLFTNRQVHSIDEINQTVKGKTVSIRFRDKTVVSGRYVHVSDRSIMWTHHGTLDERPFDSVSEIYYSRPGRGVLIGAAPAVVASVAILLTPEGKPHPADPQGIIRGSTEAIKYVGIAGLTITSIGIGGMMEGNRKYLMYQAD